MLEKLVNIIPNFRHEEACFKTHRNRDQRHGYQKGKNVGMCEKGKVNTVNNIVKVCMVTDDY